MSRPQQWEKVKDSYRKLNQIISDLVIGHGDKNENLEELQSTSKKLAVQIHNLEAEDITYRRK